MASAFTHAFFAATLGTVMMPGQRKLIALGALCAILPDADVVSTSGVRLLQAALERLTIDVRPVFAGLPVPETFKRLYQKGKRPG